MKSLFLRIVALTFFGLCAVSCSSPQVSQYAKEKPTLDLTEYFSGTIDAYGIFTDRSGAVKKRFTVLIKADWTIVNGKKWAHWMKVLSILMGSSKSVSGL